MARFIYNIEDENLDDFNEGFLESIPVPTNEKTGKPEMSENEWIQFCGNKYFFDNYRKGKETLAVQQVVINKDIVKG